MRFAVLLLLVVFACTPCGCKSLRDRIRGDGLDPSNADWSNGFRGAPTTKERSTGLTEKSRAIERNLGFE